MIKKLKWETLATQVLPTRLDNSITALDTLITNVNNKQATLMGQSNIAVIYNEVKISLCRDINNPSPWKDLLIYVSSFKENDCRFTQLLIQKIMEYASFYYKVLTDEGVQRALVYSKTYNNSGTSSSTERNADSVTPQNPNLYNENEQTANNLFDQAIANYASSIGKNKANTTSSTQGGSKTNVTGTTWEEAKRNLQMVFYNELCDYLMSIPERIYRYYSIDTIPAPELAKMMYHHINEVLEMFKSDE